MRFVDFLLIFLMVSPAMAERAPDPQIEAALRLIEAMQIDTQLESMADTMRPIMFEQLKMAFADGELSPEAEQVVRKYADRIANLAYTKENLQKMKLDIAAVYSEDFTVAEMDAISQFYGTPAGQALISKLPSATQKVMQLSMETQREIMREASEFGVAMAAEIAGLDQEPKED